jgi:hypothetical protein
MAEFDTESLFVDLKPYVRRMLSELEHNRRWAREARRDSFERTYVTAAEFVLRTALDLHVWTDAQVIEIMRMAYDRT